MALRGSRYLLLVLVFFASALGEQTIPLPLERDEITASAVAEVIPDWKALPGETVLGYSPLPGVERRITRGQLARWAEREGLVADTSSWPAALIATRRMVGLPKATVQQLLTHYLAADRGADVSDVSVSLIGYSPIEVPAGELEFAVEVLDAPPSAAWLFTFTWIDSAGRAGSARLRANVELPEHSREPNATRHASLGVAFRPATRKAETSIRRGTALTLVATSSGVQLQVPAKAMEAGRVGDWILCENLQSGMKVRARLTSSKQAEVLLP